MEKGSVIAATFHKEELYQMIFILFKSERENKELLLPIIQQKSEKLCGLPGECLK